MSASSEEAPKRIVKLFVSPVNRLRPLLPFDPLNAPMRACVSMRAAREGTDAVARVVQQQLGSSLGVPPECLGEPEFYAVSWTYEGPKPSEKLVSNLVMVCFIRAGAGCCRLQVQMYTAVATIQTTP